MPLEYLRTPVLVSLLVARACGEQEPEAVPPPPSASGTLPAIAAPPAIATHGGALVAAGPAQLEVVTHASGEVYAYPAVGISDPARARVTTTIAVQDGTRPVELRWLPRENRYVGRVRDATVIPGPATLTVIVGGVQYVGISPILVVSPAIVVAVAPAVVEVGYHGKHKHRGHGHGHGHDGVRVRVR